MKRVWVCFLLLLMLPFVSAQSEWLPDPGTAPDSPFYIVKKFFEGVDLFFIPEGDVVALVNRHMELSELRLSEAKAMFEAGRPELVERLLIDYDNELSILFSFAESGEDRAGLSEWLVKLTRKHWAFLDELEVDFNGSAVLVDFKDVVSFRNEGALRLLTFDNVRLAVKLSFDIAGDRIPRIRKAAVRNWVDVVAWERGKYTAYLNLASDFSVGAPADIHLLVVQEMDTHLSVISGIISSEGISDLARVSFQEGYDRALSVRGLAVDALGAVGAEVPGTFA